MLFLSTVGLPWGCSFDESVGAGPCSEEGAREDGRACRDGSWVETDASTPDTGAGDDVDDAVVDGAADTVEDEVDGCQPSEVCGNDRDDDCDGTTDEGCACDYTGTSEGVCSAGVVGPDGTCKKPSKYENDETSCDDKDNDCDGDTDEDCSCAYDGKSSGVCQNGTVDPSTGDCQKPDDYESPEASCDDKDNDCDGDTDDSDSDLTCTCSAGETSPCYSGPSGTAGEGICSEGSKSCESDGTWGNCMNETTPSSEGSGSNCDNQDNDCDGHTDEGCTCDYKSKSSGVCTGEKRTSTGKCPTPNDYEDPESTCSDSLDNDCDGGTDCSDSDCTGSLCGTGSGATCRSMTCIETACGDGTDNDQDSNTDCADSDCNRAACGSGSGALCKSGSCTETDCGDGTDNDRDGKTDCEDANCDTLQCDGSGTTCVSTDGDCHETACNDDSDNDSDGLTDVCDGDCSGNCGTGASCSNKQSGVCSETDCGDGTDNDNDGATDCADPDCSTCGAGTTCSGGTCLEMNCGDGLDNDHDGNTDCGDSDCNGRQCGGTGTQCASGDSNCHESACGDDTDNDGDGYVDCGDGDCGSSSGCNQRIFITGATYDGNLGGLSGADQKCNTAATNAGLSGTWRAILSTSSTDAKSHISVSGRVHNVKGDKVVDGSSDMWDGNLDHPVRYDETGGDLQTGASQDDWIWSGTARNGTLRNPSSGSPQHCSDWSTNDLNSQGFAGDSGDSGFEWIEEDYLDGDERCSRQLRLYCIDGQ